MKKIIRNTCQPLRECFLNYNNCILPWKHDEFYGKRYNVGKAAIKPDLVFAEFGQMVTQVRPFTQAL